MAKLQKNVDPLFLRVNPTNVKYIAHRKQIGCTRRNLGTDNLGLHCHFIMIIKLQQ
jgi:hypothetical protein